ncbi:PREDICTED: probable myosin-binding protein 6 [Ipomoea nil]|uniref:probable myosin-binding protein 6 n=1 Tax=Ipomoea nil TaxID=35883 RepID=UPI0009015A2D|nr:PREDICTED: probable myosin-binding protein 6 [Ipomoea nil]
MKTLPFKCFVEQNLGRQGLAFIYAILEFVMVLLLLVDGILGFFSAEFARFFELEAPCFVCTRIMDPAFAFSSSNCCHGCVCEAHKKDISSLAYCHAHRILSDIRSMCEECILSFAAHTDGDCERYKSLLGVMHNNSKDKDIVIDYKDPETAAARFWSRDFEEPGGSVIPRCSCCGELLSTPKCIATATSMKAGVAPPPSPSHTPPPQLHNPHGDELPHSIPYTQLMVSNNDSHQLPDNEEEDDNVSNEESGGDQLPEDAASKTPSFIKGGNKFLGIPLSDNRSIKMSMDILPDVAADTNEGDGEKKQVLMALCMELDEERNASAIAANNAMAMITRLQAEKAAVKMEALQHKRMMEEHAEYYREELQVMKDMLLKREEELKDLELELGMYREKFGSVTVVGSEMFHSGEYINENMLDLDCSMEIENERSRLFSMFSSFQNKFNPASNNEEYLLVKLEDQEDQQHLGGIGNEKKVTFTRERSDIGERLRAIEAESGCCIKHTTVTLQRGDVGINFLTEIADNLKKLREL